MIKSALTKIGLGLALFSGCAILQPAVASAQNVSAHVQQVDHGDHDRGGRRDRGRGWDHDRGRDRGYWRGDDHDHWRRGYSYYPGYGSGLGFYFGTTPSYNYNYGAPSYPAPAYPQVSPYPPSYSYPY